MRIRLLGFALLCLLPWITACAGGAADPGTLVVLTHAPSGEVRFMQFGSGKITERIKVGGELVGALRDSARGVVYVMDRGGIVTSVDVLTRRVRSTVMVGREPQAMTLAPDGRRLFVALGGDSTLAVIDAATFQVTTRVPVGGRPAGIAVASDGGRVFVSVPTEKSIVTIDSSSGRRAARPIQVAAGVLGPMAVSNDGGSLVGASASGLWSVQLSSREVREVSLGAVAADGAPRAVAQTPDSRYWLVTFEGGREVAAVPTDGREPFRIKLDQDASDIAVAPGGRLLVSSQGGEFLLEVDPDTAKVTRRIRVEGGHSGVTVFSRATLDSLRATPAP